MYWPFGSWGSSNANVNGTAASPAPPPPPETLPSPPPQPTQQMQGSPPFDPRARSKKQLGLFFAGASFFTIATFVTRRSISRKQIAAFPKFFQPSHRPATQAPGPKDPLIALEALNLATLNVVSFFMMLTGGAAWGLDVCGVEDLRVMARRHLGPSGGRTDEDAEREVAEWVSKVLGRKDLEGQAGNAVEQPKS